MLDEWVKERRTTFSFVKSTKINYFHIKAAARID